MTGGSQKMKRFVSVLLVITVLLALGVPAFAAGSPTGSGKKDEAMSGLVLYNSDDKVIGVVPTKDIIRYNVRQADNLDAADKEAFLAAYEDARNVDDKVVLQAFWLDVPDEYKTGDFAYARYYFNTVGRNIGVSVNGNDMEVGRLGNRNYFAKLTEFGTVVITRN